MNVARDEQEQGKSPKPSGEQDAPAPERPVPEEEVRRTEGQADKPSQAEGDRGGATGG
ncbi:MAG TPA: hypothetical protein VGR37_15175 [Longimicrobiaceae bacterium]|nr:hypothetical protein [Longimicrobiaceae bacterium]